MPEDPQQTKAECPQCGEPLHRWPTLGSSGYLLTCDGCGFEQSVDSSNQLEANPAEEEAIKPSDISSERLRTLMSQSDQPTDWPDELLEELPEEARQRLQANPSTEKTEIPPDLEKRVRGYGYVLSADGTGARLSGEGPKPGTGDLSPFDVVRLAAEMEGGVPTGGEKRTCPSCQAVLPPGSESCQWCGREITDSETGPSQ